jgi:hypothetical protein
MSCNDLIHSMSWPVLRPIGNEIVPQTMDEVENETIRLLAEEKIMPYVHAGRVIGR